MKKPRILSFDIETGLIPVWVFNLGKQVVTHNQLMTDDAVTDIICITYCWDNGKSGILSWDPSKGETSEKIITEFDELVKSADIVLGQNSDRFDVKHINTQRLIHDLPPFPEWSINSEDTLKQVRKYFKFPSNRLDYMSRLFKFGGKQHTELKDWKNIANYINTHKLINLAGRVVIKRLSVTLYGKDLDTILKDGLKSLNLMKKYGLKDAKDTMKIWKKIRHHVVPKYNAATTHTDIVCSNCGSKNIIKNGTRAVKKSVCQFYYCKDHGGYAGKTVINKAGKEGRIGG